MPRRGPRWSGWAWAAIGVAVAFVGITCWWLARDRGVPFADAASHLYTVVIFHDLLLEGDLAEIWHRSYFYPPTTFLVGALATFVGGVDAAAPVIGQNVVYVPLLALGCYKAARLLAGPQAGFLAVVFALGAPLLIEQFHVFMIDAPLAALVALSVWLILLTDRFGRLGVSALAGVVFGIGLASKEQFPLFLAGLLLVTVVRRGGWRNWRGIALFAGIAFAIGAPWYLANFSHLSLILSAASGPQVPPRGRPPTLSIANLGWYFWALLNGVLFAPLALYAAAGTARAAALVARGRAVARAGRRDDLLPELLAGGFVGWLGISLTPHHDMRYAMSLVPYLAVLGTAWIPPLAWLPRRLATAGLLAAALAATLGLSFGLGPDVRLVLGGERVVTDVSWGIPSPNEVTVHADHDFNVSAPRRGDDVLGLFEAMRRDGVTGVAWLSAQTPLGDPLFDIQGLVLFARFADLKTPSPGGARFDSRDPPPGYPAADDGKRWLRSWWNLADPNHVFVLRAAAADGEPPCMRLRDGSGLWLRRGEASTPGPWPYCPALD
jgi:hypothetical protein